MSLDIDEIEKSTLICGLEKIAALCSVTIERVYEWIDQKRFPVKFYRGTWRIRKGDLDEWIENGFKSPARVFYMKEVSVDIITCFQDFETGKSCLAPTSYRMPLTWKPRLDDLISAFPQFDGKMTNFMRAAVFNFMMDLTELRNQGAVDTDPRLASIAFNSRMRADYELNSKTFQEIKRTAEIVKKQKHLPDIEKFLKSNEEQVEKLPFPWRGRASKILTSLRKFLKELERGKSRKEIEEDDWDEDEEDDGEDGFDFSDDVSDRY